jgi:hypothetical protein
LALTGIARRAAAFEVGTSAFLPGLVGNVVVVRAHARSLRLAGRRAWPSGARSIQNRICEAISVRRSCPVATDCRTRVNSSDSPGPPSFSYFTRGDLPVA